MDVELEEWRESKQQELAVLLVDGGWRTALKQHAGAAAAAAGPVKLVVLRRQNSASRRLAQREVDRGSPGVLLCRHALAL